MPNICLLYVPPILNGGVMLTGHRFPQPFPTALAAMQQYNAYVAAGHTLLPDSMRHQMKMLLSDNHNWRPMRFTIHPCQGCSAVLPFLTQLSSQDLEKVLIVSTKNYWNVFYSFRVGTRVTMANPS